MGIARIKSYFKNKIRKVRDFFQWYTTGLSRKEIERMLHKDALEALTYYKEKTTLKDSPPEQKSLKSKITVFKEIFLSFLMQLTPARRFFYGLSFVGFVLALLTAKVIWILGAFIILNGLLGMELADKLTTRDELEIAREIQVSLEPKQVPEFPWLSVSFSSMPVKSGDVLLLYSDGITEAMNSNHQLFDQSRLESALKESAHFPAEKIVERINLRWK
jgi:hypothetical protein